MLLVKTAVLLQFTKDFGNRFTQLAIAVKSIYHKQNVEATD